MMRRERSLLAGYERFAAHVAVDLDRAGVLIDDDAAGIADGNGAARERVGPRALRKVVGVKFHNSGLFDIEIEQGVRAERDAVVASGRDVEPLGRAEIDQIADAQRHGMRQAAYDAVDGKAHGIGAGGKTLLAVDRKAHPVAEPLPAESAVGECGRVVEAYGMLPRQRVGAQTVEHIDGREVDAECHFVVAARGEPLADALGKARYADDDLRFGRNASHAVGM